MPMSTKINGYQFPRIRSEYRSFSGSIRDIHALFSPNSLRHLPKYTVEYFMSQIHRWRGLWGSPEP
jgi:hypothetical protein